MVQQHRLPREAVESASLEASQNRVDMALRIWLWVWWGWVGGWTGRSQWWRNRASAGSPVALLCSQGSLQDVGRAWEGNGREPVADVQGIPPVPSQEASTSHGFDPAHIVLSKL